MLPVPPTLSFSSPSSPQSIPTTHNRLPPYPLLPGKATVEGHVDTVPVKTWTGAVYCTQTFHCIINLNVRLMLVWCSFDISTKLTENDLWKDPQLPPTPPPHYLLFTDNCFNACRRKNQSQAVIFDSQTLWWSCPSTKVIKLTAEKCCLHRFLLVKDKQWCFLTVLACTFWIIGLIWDEYEYLKGRLDWLCCTSSTS